MATGDHVLIKKDFFHCSICLELYESPRSLPCLHSFCHICLYGYIQKVSDKPDKQNLLCPICRADTKTDNDTFNSVEKWVRSFPINFNLLSILNDVELKMNTSENFCEPCIREENKSIATVFCFECSEKLCEECRRHHRKNKLLCRHKLIEIGEKSASLDLKELEYLAHLSKCPKHCSEEVRYLCQDHDQLCCNECAIVTHRKCENMVSLADEVQKKGVEIDIESLEDIENRADKLIEHESSFIIGLDRKEEEVKGRLKQFKTDINRAYAQLEYTVLSKMTEERKQLTKVSTSNAESAEKLKNDVKRSAAKVTKISELGSATHMFLLEKEIKEKYKQYEEQLNTLLLNTSRSSWTLTAAEQTKDIPEAIRNSFQLNDGKALLLWQPTLRGNKRRSPRESSKILGNR